jgi:hypothetical protein
MATLIAQQIAGKFCGSTSSKIAGMFVMPLIPNPFNIIVYLVTLFSIRYGKASKLNGGVNWNNTLGTANYKTSALNALWIYYLVMLVFYVFFILIACKMVSSVG